MGWLSLQVTTVFITLLIPFISTQETDEPSWAPTGKLSQFRGYVTPRPFPSNAHLVYASVWAGWSSWSYCSNGVQIRVRACNTVRGFSCLGPNQEVLPCDGPLSSNTIPAVPTDYDVVDPYEADRREAMRQLYPDDFPVDAPVKSISNVRRAPKNSGPVIRVFAPQPFRVTSATTTNRPKTVKTPTTFKHPKVETSFQKTVQVFKKEPKENITAKILQLHNDELEEALRYLRIRGDSRSNEDKEQQQKQQEQQQQQQQQLQQQQQQQERHAVQQTTATPTPLITTENEKEASDAHEWNGQKDTTDAKFLKNSNLLTNGSVVEFPTEELMEVVEKTDTKPNISVNGEHLTKTSSQPINPKFNVNVVKVESNRDKTSSDEFPVTTTTSTSSDTTVFITNTTTPPSTTSTLRLRVTTQQWSPRLTSKKPVKKFSSVAENDMMAFLSLMEGKTKHRIIGDVTSSGFSKKSPLSPKPKSKGFGFTGFKFRKIDTSLEKRFVHTGEVNEKLKSPKHIDNATEKLSIETLNALDWMLRNITEIKEDGESAFRKALSTIDSSVNDETVFTDQIISTTEKAEIVIPVMKNGRPASSKPYKVTKSKKSRRKGAHSKKRANSSVYSNVRLHTGEFMPHVIDRNNLYPKFRRRVTAASRARLFGVQTVINDKDKDGWNQTLSPGNSHQHGSTYSTIREKTKPAELLKEIEALESLMSDVEKRIKAARNSSDHKQQTKPLTISRPQTRQSALDLSLVPSESGYLPMSSVSQQEFHQQPIHLITDTDMIVAVSRWTDWNEWGDCICKKQIRTRQCVYSGSLSQGCEGDSYESRDCRGGWCPRTSTPFPKPKLIEINRQTDSSDEIHHPHRILRPFKLFTASSLS